MGAARSKMGQGANSAGGQRNTTGASSAQGKMANGGKGTPRPAGSFGTQAQEPDPRPGPQQALYGP